MVAHLNFYENLKEAHIRLNRTFVLYDGVPYYVFAITNHHKDGIFRVYLDPIGHDQTKRRVTPYSLLDEYNPEHPELGKKLDAWLEVNPNTDILRKQMNSPLFNKFRPYPLGMCNVGNNVVYCERQPTRKTEQGLTGQMLSQVKISLTDESNRPTPGRGMYVEINSPHFRACILGEHPSAKECLAALNSGQYANEALAFHREFAFIRGPVGLLFMAYKGDIVGVLPKSDLSFLRLDPEFIHAKEVIEKLSLFAKII